MSNMVVRTNIYAQNAHRNMKNVGLQQKQASNRLSSGYRINSAADDAAGLAISETMRAQIRGLDQASRNAQDGQAMLLTTEGGLEEIGNILQRVRELLVQASNDNNTQGQRKMIEQEIGQLGQEVLGMQERVEFNTNKVLAMGNSGASDFATGWGTFADAISDLADERATFDAAVTALADAKTSFATAQKAWDKANADYAIDGISTALASAAASYSAAQEAWGDAQDDYADALSDWTDAVNTWTTEFTSARDEVIDGFKSTLSGNYEAWFQVGANADQGIRYDFETVSRVVATNGNLVSMIANGMVTLGTLSDTGVGYGENLSVLIGNIQTGLDELNKVRANLGAVQNRMDYTMRSLDISSENLADSESRVRNADIAKEMMKFTMTNVLQQAAVSMLAQANQMPNNLLQLLR